MEQFIQLDESHLSEAAQLYKEALHNEYTGPRKQQILEINDIVNGLIADGTLSEWKRFDNPQRFKQPYGTQKGWEKIRKES